MDGAFALESAATSRQGSPLSGTLALKVEPLRTSRSHSGAVPAPPEVSALSPAALSRRWNHPLGPKRRNLSTSRPAGRGRHSDGGRPRTRFFTHSAVGSPTNRNALWTN